MNSDWILAGGRRIQPAPFCVVGIVNVTPDSFFDGGQYLDPARAVEHGLRLLDEGADLLDVGAESTRPGAHPPRGAAMRMAAMAEVQRLEPVMIGLRRARPASVLCVDTCHGLTAARMLELGADVINDVSACGRDPSLLEVLAQYQPGYVLMHGGDQGGVVPADAGNGDHIVEAVLHFFAQALTRLVRAGVPENRIVLDPGIGFGKTNAQSAQLLGQVERLQELGRPLYVGVSMKSLFGDLVELPLGERGEATRIASALLAARGVAYHRVHDVAATRRALTLVHQLCPLQGA